MSFRSATVFDVDGVLADNSKQLDAFIKKFLPGKPSSAAWEYWYVYRMNYCKPRPEYKMLASVVGKSESVLLVTARPERYRESTEKWLWDNSIYHDMLYMWDECVDFNESKCEHLAKIKRKYSVSLFIDDSEHWCQIARSMDILALHATEGYTSMVHQDIAQPAS